MDHRPCVCHLRLRPYSEFPCKDMNTQVKEVMVTMGFEWDKIQDINKQEVRESDGHVLDPKLHETQGEEPHHHGKALPLL